MKGLTDTIRGLAWFFLIAALILLGVNLTRFVSWGGIPVGLAVLFGVLCASCLERDERLLSGFVCFWIAAAVTVGIFFQHGIPHFSGLPGKAQFLAMQMSLGHEWDLFARDAGLLATWPVFFATFASFGGFAREEEPQAQGLVQL
jgi:hypothetical protein